MSATALSAVLRIPPSALPVVPAPVRRQRAKLWELNESVHCSIIGTCLTTAELRRVMAKAVRDDVSAASDHDLHSRAVGLCSRHTLAAKLLGKALDQRHDAAVRRFNRLHGEEAVLQGWSEHRKAGDIPGAYWAVLTHPDTGHAGMRKAFGDVHMLSHLVGAANRADIRRLTALEEENAALRAKVERQQAKLHQTISSRDATIQRLGDLAARQISRDEHRANDEALAGLQHLVADLQRRLERETDRRERLERRTAETAAALEACRSSTAAAEARAAAAERDVAALERSAEAAADGAAVLPPLRVLYVGGRPAAIGRMRAMLDDAGGSVLVHDGGRHDHPSLLPGLVGQADLVVFPVDCVSHDAALTVKRLCRQQSRPWAPLRTSGLGSFLAALCQPPSMPTSAPTSTEEIHP